jgi:D-alanyl-D-alanine carboxypeptidase
MSSKRTNLHNRVGAMKHFFLTLFACAALHADVQDVVSQHGLSSAYLGISVVDLETGEALYAVNETKNFVPCSVLKLWTAASALDQLGPDFQLITYVWMTRDGDLVWKGEWTLSSPAKICNCWRNRWPGTSTKRMI